MSDRSEPKNPFRYGALAFDEAFTDRERELRELKSDIRNGQDVVVFAPRRYGKSSLVLKALQDLRRQGVLSAQVDLMTAPTKEKLAEKLAKAIHEGIASPLYRAREPFYRRADLTVDTSALGPDQVAARIALLLAERTRGAGAARAAGA